MTSEPIEKCGYRADRGLWAPLVCDRQKGHTGTHIDGTTYPNVAVGFSWPNGEDTRVSPRRARNATPARV